METRNTRMISSVSTLVSTLFRSILRSLITLALPLPLWFLESKKFTHVEYSKDLVPEGRAGHMAVVQNNEMIVFGGYCGDGGFTYLGDCLALPLS